MDNEFRQQAIERIADIIPVDDVRQREYRAAVIVDLLIAAAVEQMAINQRLGLSENG